MPAQREDLLPGHGIPDLDGLIQASGGDAAAVGAEGDSPEPAYVAVQAEDLASRVGIPNLDVLIGVHAEMAADRGEAAAVGAEREFLEASLRPRKVSCSCPVFASHSWTTLH